MFQYEKNFTFPILTKTEIGALKSFFMVTKAKVCLNFQTLMTPYNGTTIWDMYRRDPAEEIPEDYRIVGFAPPAPRQIIFSVFGYVTKCTSQFHETCPRLILEEVEPCELCGDKEPVTLT